MILPPAMSTVMPVIHDEASEAFLRLREAAHTFDRRLRRGLSAGGQAAVEALLGGRLAAECGTWAVAVTR